jgi:DNA-directed RNA polymerase specialized sigma24 family protein
MDEDDKSTTTSRADVDALLQKQDWGRMHARLLAFALGRTKKNRAAAQDAVQEAIMRVLDAHWEPWNPEKQPDLFTFLTGIVNRLLSNDRTSARVHREIAMDRQAKEGTRALKLARKVERIPDKGDGASSPEERVALSEVLAPRMASLRAAVENDELARELLDEVEDGNDIRRDHVRITGHTSDEVKAARRRLARHVVRIAREIPEEGDEESK